MQIEEIRGQIASLEAELRPTESEADKLWKLKEEYSDQWVVMFRKARDIKQRIERLRVKEEAIAELMKEVEAA